MASSLSIPKIVFFTLLARLCCPGAAAATTFGLNFHHRFSENVRTWAESVALDVRDWPEKDTFQYYAKLVAHDKELLRGRGLTGSEVTFAQGNQTIKLNALGFLHYLFVNLGTPNVTFLVALDTGSDLFWVPCDCNRCSPTFNDAYNLTFNIFSSSASSTSKEVPCSSALCVNNTSCSSPTDTCSYTVKYLSSNTSSSGILLEDVLHLVTDDVREDAVDARVTFGCGQVQTGSFLKSGAPNGVFGLGLDKVSVPSLLASSGRIADSFSMCFSNDGLGRITFGDEGSSDQSTTPIRHIESHPTYGIVVNGISVGRTFLDVNFSAIFDTGTSFSILSDPAYTLLGTSFDSLAQDPRIDTGSDFMFEYCYSIAPDAQAVRRPNITLTMDGGKKFSVLHPLVIFRQEDNSRFYCLAVLKAGFNFNLIGQNFMTGLKVIFNREKQVLGWKPFDCYNVENSMPLPVDPPSPSPIPPPISTVSSGGLTPPPVASRQHGGSKSLTTNGMSFTCLVFPLFFIMLSPL